jgi:hypothetical protein
MCLGRQPCCADWMLLNCVLNPGQTGKDHPCFGSDYVPSALINIKKISGAKSN